MKIRLYSIIFLLIALFAVGCENAGKPFESVAQLVSKTQDGLAVRGYDVVAYRTIENATLGKPEYNFAWRGAKWLFISKENRDRFAADPDAYAPAYGGFCAWSLAEGSRMEADPEQWEIVNGKLYLLQSKQIRETWMEKPPVFIEKGDENWQKMQTK